MSITVLHISDLHYDPQKSTDQGIVLDAFFRDIAKLREERGIVPDMAAFSGDLVQAGEAAETFSQAHEHFVTRLWTELDIPKQHFFIVPGNHDIDRTVVRRAEFVEVGLKAQLSSTTAVNEFIEQALAGENLVALERLRVYSDYIEQNFPETHCLSNPFVTVDKCDVHGTEVAIASFNTAWRSTGEGGHRDNKVLLMGERVVDLAVQHTADAAVRLALFHHPLDWLSDPDFLSVEGRLQSCFDVLLYGHLHVARPSITATADGSAVMSQVGCLYLSRDYFNGYSIITIDPVTRSTKFLLRTYQRMRREFDSAVDVMAGGSIEFSLKGRTGGREAETGDLLKAARPVVRRKANRHLATLSCVDPATCDIKQMFVEPPLSRERDYNKGMVAEQGGDAATAALGLETMLRAGHDYVIYGKRESGKTSLAHYLAVQVTEGTCDRMRVPVVLDFRQIRMGHGALWRNVRNYLSDIEPAMLKRENILGSLLVILDNFQTGEESERRLFESLQQEAPRARWICLGEEQLASMARPARPDGFEVAFIQQLPRRAIRQLSHRWCAQMGRDATKTYEAVMGQLKRAHLPRTGYMVALLLWAMYRSIERRQLNEAVLLENVLEYLLEKADYTLALRREFDYRSKEITLQALARFLKDHDDYADINDVLAEIIRFFKESGLNYGAGDVLQQFIEAGVLERAENEVRFKYKCFQEYFVAGCVAEERRLYEELFDSHKFTEYARELDLLTSRNRRRHDVLERLGDQLESLCPAEFRCGIAGFTEVEVGEGIVQLAEDALLHARGLKLTQEQIDDVMDFADEKIAQFIEERRDLLKEGYLKDKVRYLMTLDLYGRVLRNLEFIPVDVKRAYLKDYLARSVEVIKALRNMGMTQIEELLERVKEEDPKKREEMIKYFNYYTKIVMPNIILSAMAEEIGTPKLEEMFEESLSAEGFELGTRVAALFILFDLGAHKRLEYWREFSKREGRERYVQALMLAKLGRYYSTNPLEKAEREGLESLIADIVIGRSQPKQLKGYVISELRKKKRIADAGGVAAGGEEGVADGT
jgi:predicted MPP superfamily phosphohydrolase